MVRDSEAITHPTLRFTNPRSPIPDPLKLLELAVDFVAEPLLHITVLTEQY
jgi:hypothetical protein